MKTLKALWTDETGGCIHELAFIMALAGGAAFGLLYVGAIELKNTTTEVYRFAPRSSN